MRNHCCAAEIIDKLIHNFRKFSRIFDMFRSNTMNSDVKEEKRISLGRINRSTTRITRPFSIHAKPTEQALPAVHLRFQNQRQ